MKDKIKKSSIKNKKRNYTKISLILLFIIGTFFLTIGYSAFQSNLQIGDISAIVRIEKDIRVTNVKVNSASQGSISEYEEYNVSNITSSISLPSSDSYLIYDVDIHNLGNVEMAISSLNLDNDNLTYELLDYDIATKICNDNVCKSGVKKTIKIKIKYKDGKYDSSNTNQKFRLDFVFSAFYGITYNSIYESSSLPNQILEGTTLKITFTSKYDKLSIKMKGNELVLNTDYTFDGTNLIIPNVDGNIIISNSSDILSSHSVEFDETKDGLQIISYGNGEYELNGTYTGTTALYIRLSDYYIRANDNKYLITTATPSDESIVYKDDIVKFNVDVISGSTKKNTNNTFRLVFRKTNDVSALSTIGYDFVTGYYGENSNNIYTISDDIGMTSLYITKENSVFDHYRFKISLVKMNNSEDSGEIEENTYDSDGYISNNILLNLKGKNAPNSEGNWVDTDSSKVMQLTNVLYDSDNKYYKFNNVSGTESFGTIGYSIIPITGDFTLEAYIETSNPISNTDQAIVSQVNDTSNDSGRFKLNLYNKKLLLFYNSTNGNNTIYYTNSEVTTETKYLMQVVKNNDKISIYLNGTKIGTNTITTTNQISSGPFKLAKWNNATKQLYIGNIYSVRVYKQALSSEQLKNNKNVDLSIYG